MKKLRGPANCRLVHAQNETKFSYVNILLEDSIQERLHTFELYTNCYSIKGEHYD